MYSMFDVGLHEYKQVFKFLRSIFFHLKMLFCPSNFINEMKLDEFLNGIHVLAFYKVIAMLPTMDIIYKFRKKGCAGAPGA